jgi:hypothetical protein
MSIPWWESNPGRLEYELAALAREGIACERDEVALAHGIIRLKLRVDVAGELIPLEVTFPDLYPYFRFEVSAPTLALGHHQNPFGKNLCLIGRETFYWNPDDTVAGLIQEQLPTVLETGRSADKEAALGQEHRQAEPIGVFYPYWPSMVVMPSGCVVPGHFDCGTFAVAATGPQSPPPNHFVRGILAELRSRNGDLLVEADPRMLSAFTGDQLQGYWVRTAEPIRHAELNNFMTEVFKQFPSAKLAPANRVDGGWLQIWGVVFPEEVAWRESGDGWVFVGLFSRQRSGLVSASQRVTASRPAPHKKRKGKKKRKR